jgi:hypothetical protein
MGYHYYRISDGRYWGSSMELTETDGFSYTLQNPPGHDPLTEYLIWNQASAEWQVQENITGE